MRIAAPLATLSFVAMLVTATVGLAQSADAQAEASRHFWVGLELVRESAWDAALAEFLRSRELFATANALENAAVCLRELGRFDEALDLYDELIARFSTSLPAAERALVDADVKRLTPYVGSVSIDSRPPGAALFFDGRARGTTPARTLRALVGTRSVRVVHEAYAPFEGKVRVTSGETSALSADLVAASLVGHVQVAERSGGVYEVLIDGVVVGVTPWEGTLTQGTHTVALRSEAERGTEPRAIEVDLAHPLDLVLDARPLLGQLRVEPTPADARIRVDGKDVGRGSWSGYLQPGEHGVSASADWHETTTMTVRTSSRSPRVLRPTLRTVPRMSAELWAGPTPYSDLGARNAPNCNAGCVGSVVGLAGGYALTQRLSLQLFTLYVHEERYSNRPLTLTTTDSRVISSGAYGEDLGITMFAGGAAIRYRLFDRTPLTFQFLAAGARGWMEASAGGVFTDPSGLFGLSHLGTQTHFWSPVFGPDVRFGYRFDLGITLDVGMGALFFVLPRTAPDTTPAVQDRTVSLPAGPWCRGGLSVGIPVTAALHMDL